MGKRTAGDLTLRQLEVFIALVELKNQQRVADQLQQLTQPGVSRELSRLRECVEPRLLFAEDENYELTTFGDQFLEAARTATLVLRAALPPIPPPAPPSPRISASDLKA